jgi:hypothetical protein
MRLLALMLASAFSITCASQSQAVVRIANDRGGLIQRYLDRYDELKGTGQTVVIDGLCASACTIVLAKIPSDRVCVTERANLLSTQLGISAPADAMLQTAKLHG